MGQEDRLWSQTAGVQNLSPTVGLGASYRTPLCLSEWTLTGMPHRFTLSWDTQLLGVLDDNDSLHQGYLV